MDHDELVTDRAAMGQRDGRHGPGEGGAPGSGAPARDVIFTPLRFRNLTVRNRVFRSNLAGRFANYDGSGTRALITFEEQFARGGVGAILSSHVPVHARGRVLPHYATIERDADIPFWRAL